MAVLGTGAWLSRPGRASGFENQLGQASSLEISSGKARGPCPPEPVL